MGWLALVFGISLGRCLNPYKISNSVLLGISMLVNLRLLGHWELAESAISPLQSIMSASAVHVVH